MPKIQHPTGCQCDRGACRKARIEAEPKEWEFRRAYFADADPYPRFGPTSLERQAARRQANADLDEEARALKDDLWLLRHAGVGQELGALRRIIDRLNRDEAQRTR